jgi:hypothetical protein
VGHSLEVHKPLAEHSRAEVLVVDSPAVALVVDSPAERRAARRRRSHTRAVEE